MKFSTLAKALLLTWLVSSSASGAEKVLKEINVYPADINLDSAKDRQSLVVVATYTDGVTVDVSQQAKFSLSNTAIAKLTGCVVQPLADGNAELTIEYAGQSKKIPIVSKQAKFSPPISFRLDVMPVFMKAGCNSGSCHGSARGKDGFRLSLFGFDAEGDYHRLTREQQGRRINLALPKECLLVEKATGQVPHTGGKRIEQGSDLLYSVYSWLESGAPNDPPTVAKPLSLEILPRQAVLEGKDSKMQMTVRAKFSDGTDRDVTGLALFLSNNESAAAISPAGVVNANERGEAFVMARFHTFTVGSQVIVIPKGDFQFTNPPENNYIDTLIHAKLKKLRVVPSDLCSDQEYIRRVFIDVTGTLPTRAEYDRFQSDKDPKKREKLVDELLGRKEFSEIWVMKFAELLQMRSTQNVSYKAMLQYYNWLQQRIASNVPMDQIVRELLSANGGTFKLPATNYFQLETDTLKVSENVAQVFMGMRVQCAQCHNHPFDRWTMDDYYGFAAFFSQIGRKPGEDPREVVVFNSGGGEVAHPVGGRVMQPKFLGGITPDLKGRDRREVLADWIASPENPFFARNLANIVWAHFFGKGIIEPVDDVRVSNPAINPELLDELARKFTSYNYDFKRLVRDICTSRTYQLSTAVNPTNELDMRNFSHAQLRRVRSEVLLDCISQVTETKNKFPGLPLGARAVQIADGQVSTYFLTTFGRATRETACSCEVKMEPNLSQALHLLNGDTTTQRIAQGAIIPKMLAEKKTPQQVIDEIYLRCLSRPPRADESAKFAGVLKQEKNTQKALEDIFWAVLNSKEFLFNR